MQLAEANFEEVQFGGLYNIEILPIVLNEIYLASGVRDNNINYNLIIIHGSTCRRIYREFYLAFRISLRGNIMT